MYVCMFARERASVRACVAQLMALTPDVSFGILQSWLGPCGIPETDIPAWKRRAATTMSKVIPSTPAFRLAY